MRVFLNNIKELVITAGYGERSAVHTTSHTGIDIKFATGEKILSPVSGVVSRVVDYGSENIGKGIMIKVDGSKELIFGHLSKIYLHTGDKVTFGMPIGEAGNTGRSFGSHLHLGLKVNGTFVNPSHYFDLLQTAYQQNVHHINQYATDVVTNKSHLYNAVSGLIQAFSN